MPMDDMYDDQGQAEEKPTTPEGMQDHEEEEGQEADEHQHGESATLPSSICPGMKPGDEMVLHIDKVLDGEYVVSYAPKEEGGEGDGKESMSMKGDEDYE